MIEPPIMSPKIQMTREEQKTLLDQSKSSAFGGASMIYNQMDMQSSVSYNSNMFKGLDSIS